MNDININAIIEDLKTNAKSWCYNEDVMYRNEGCFIYNYIVINKNVEIESTRSSVIYIHRLSLENRIRLRYQIWLWQKTNKRD